MTDQVTPPAVRWEHDDAVAVVTLDRPAALNSINAAMRAELIEAIDRADRDPDVRVVVIRGAGERAFCAGADVTEFVPPQSLTAVRAGRRERTWTAALTQARKPSIASIHGYCLGGGLEIALACDLRIAADNAIFGLPEVTLGIIPGAGGTQLLSRIVGPGHALRMTLTGQRIDAVRAREIGLVTDVVPAAELAEATRSLAQSIAVCGPVAVAYAKEAIRRGGDLSLVDGLALETDLSVMLQTTDDRAEGATAFRERREPRFTGT